MARYCSLESAARHAAFGRKWAPCWGRVVIGSAGRTHHDPSLPPVPAERLARRTAARLARARRVLTAPPLVSGLPQARAVFEALGTALADLPPAERSRVLRGPDLRGFLGEAEIWIEAVRLARRAESGARRQPAVARLFDLVARTEHLATLVPRRHLDPGFAARVARFARRRLRQALADLAACTLGLRLAGPGGRPVRLDLEPRAEPEQGRPSDRIDLGAVAGPAGFLGIQLGRGGGERRTGPGPARPRRVRALLRGRTLFLRTAGAPETVLPCAGSRLRHATGDRAPGGWLRLVVRDTIPGSPILLAPAVHSVPRRLDIGRPVPGLGSRLARALRLVRLAWPEAYDEILERTFMIVPVRESGLVSYSLASRPGISYINVFGKTTVDLADDLLHETAHHRLHDIQEIDRLLAPGPQTLEVQAFDSPWRGTKRPLHGLLHGAYTFLFREELLRRLAGLAARRPRLVRRDLRGRPVTWMRREARREAGMLAAALRDLVSAARAGLLTPAGRRLLRTMRARHARRAGR